MTANAATAVAYLRTSSKTNLEAKRPRTPEELAEYKDSRRRQEEAIYAYAEAHGLTIVGTFYDEAVSGTAHVLERPEFLRMLDYLAGNGARTILVENAGRFARDTLVQITGHDLLKARGFALIPVDSPNYFVEEGPTAKLVRTVLAAVSDFQRAELVARLKGARKRKKLETGHGEGPKPVAPEVVAMAKKLRRRDPKTGKLRTLQAISGKLAEAGYTAPSGKPYLPGSVAKMLAKPNPNPRHQRP